MSNKYVPRCMYEHALFIVYNNVYLHQRAKQEIINGG